MSELYHKQQSLLRIIERALDNFKKIGKNNYTPAKIRSRIGSLKDTWAQCIQVHAALMLATPEANRESLDYFKMKHFEVADEVVQSTLDYMAEYLDELEPSVSAQQLTPTTMSRHFDSAPSFSLSHLPPLNLPQFSGKFEEWEGFRDRFISLIVNNKDLSDFARMHFLSSSLAGQALEAIKSIPVTSDNFEIAWKALTFRYENKRRLVDIHVANILNLPAVSRESAIELSNLRDRANRSITSLRNLGRSSDEILSDILVFTVSQQVDATTRRAWKLRGAEDSDIPTYAEFDKFLASRARALEELPSHSVSKPCRPTRFSNTTAVDVSKSACVLCKASHFLNKCSIFVRKSPSQRLDVIKRTNRCINCLSSKHLIDACPSKYTCRTCNKRHHTMLHVDSRASALASTFDGPTDPRTSGDNSPSIASLSSVRSNHSSILLATARVRVGAPSGRSHVVRALIDQGSEITFMTERLRQVLRLPRIKQPLTISAVGGIDAGACRHASRILISSLDGTSPVLTATAAILATLTRYAPIQACSDGRWEHLNELTLADADFFQSDPIDLLIGSDLYRDVILEGVKKRTVGQPVAQNTIFGWILSGSFSRQAQLESRVHVQHCTTSIALDQELRRFWEVEEVPRRLVLSPEEQFCEDHFVTTHSRALNGRYMVRLPFKRGLPIDIGESRHIAERSLRQLHRRLKTQPSLASEYNHFLQEYEKLGHMRRVDGADDETTQCVYIPHHPVLREHSSTTHLRVVFNASCASSNTTSLNDHLLPGPKLQTDLAAVMLRWRTHKYVMSADIAKMYRQILIDPRDADYQRILWAPDETIPPAAFQLLTVTYGIVSAPFLALRVLKQLLQDEGHAFPLAMEILRQNIYVDDVLFGADAIPLLKQTREQVRSLLSLGHFELRKWSSNSPLLLHDIVSEDHGLACNKNLQVDEQLKILGISWNPRQDVFQFTVSLPSAISKNKRDILSKIARIFDPLGWGTPATISAKIFLQRLWQTKISWDDELPENLMAQWSDIYMSLREIAGLSMQRWTGQGADSLSCELHGFADASSSAYAAAVYLRVASVSGAVTVSLLAGKSKVAPIKTLSIPRLELSAAVLLSRLLEFSQEALHLITVPCFCWTDSTIVLAWLDQHPTKWKTFVANRVSEINSRTPTAIWRHVSTHHNPADCASRGVRGRDLADHPLWWHGPAWLRLDRSEWPPQPLIRPTSMEEKSVAVSHVDVSHGSWDLATRYSSWPKLLRVTAYMLRFISRLRGFQRTDNEFVGNSIALVPSEYRQAEIFWIRCMQSELFPKETTALLNQRPIPSRSPLCRLNPFLDDKKLIRVGGRLRNSSLPFKAKHPIVLGVHSVVSLIIRHAHLRSLHAGSQLTLATIRQDYWILRARHLVRSIIHRCVVCTRERARIPTQLMGDLPHARVNQPTRAFAHCGLDYAGPVLVRAISGRGVAARKAYIAIFVCLASRAVHLELVDGYSTPAFIAAYSRFCSRRGLPETVHSDNGTTFVGANRELTLAFRAALRDPNFQNRTVGDGVTWKFIPPSAPHFGGLWEAGVRSVKHHLWRVLGSHTLTFEKLTTLLCNIEACLNSRPLGPLTDNLEDLESLTPGHFLIGASLTAVPEPSVLTIKENRLSRWQFLRQLSERFWRIWTDDYLNTLQQRFKWRHIASDRVKVGNLVLIRNSGLPPCKWDLCFVCLSKS